MFSNYLIIFVLTPQGQHKTFFTQTNIHTCRVNIIKSWNHIRVTYHTCYRINTIVYEHRYILNVKHIFLFRYAKVFSTLLSDGLIFSQNHFLLINEMCDWHCYTKKNPERFSASSIFVSCNMRMIQMRQLISEQKWWHLNRFKKIMWSNDIRYPGVQITVVIRSAVYWVMLNARSIEDSIAYLAKLVELLQKMLL